MELTLRIGNRWQWRFRFASLFTRNSMRHKKMRKKSFEMIVHKIKA
jgi:hypothetical protein